MKFRIRHGVGVTVHAMVEIIAVAGSMSITMIVFNLSTAVTCTKELAVNIDDILGRVFKWTNSQWDWCYVSINKSEIEVKVSIRKPA